MIELVFDWGNFMKSNRYTKISLMIIISMLLFFCLIIINNESYASYGEEFKTFLVKLQQRMIMIKHMKYLLH